MLHTPRGARRILVALTALSTLALGGCAEDTIQPGLRASYQISFQAGGLPENALALYRDGDGDEDLTGVALQAALTLNGAPLGLSIGPGGPARSLVYRGTTPRLSPGEFYTFVLELPEQKGIESAVAMVADGAIANPEPGEEVSIAEGLTVTWTPAMAGEIDDVIVRGAGFAEGDHAFSGGVFQRTIEGFRLRDLLAGVPEPHGPIPAEVVLRRRRGEEIVRRPPFSDGSIEVMAEVAAVPIVLVP